MKRMVWLIVFMLVPAVAAQAEVKPEDIAGIWLLDEGKGDFAEDASGNGHEGMVTGAEWVDGKFGGGLEFDDAGIFRSKQMKPLTIHIGNRFRIIGDDDIVFDPLRRPALSYHFVNLLVNPVPEITSALRVEQNNRHRVQN